jgi:hypothetical protein
MVLLLTSFSLCSNIFARRSPPEPIQSAQVLTHGNAIGIPARHRLIFRPQTIPIRRRCVSTTRRALFSWRCRVLLRRQLVLKPLSFIPASCPVAHISLYRFFIFFHPDISSSRILHLIYTLPARTLRARTQCVLPHPNIFLPFSCGLYLTAICQPSFCILPKISGAFTRFYVPQLG